MTKVAEKQQSYIYIEKYKCYFRARVRFCLHEESNADDLTAQLANIKLDTSRYTVRGILLQRHSLIDS